MSLRDAARNFARSLQPGDDQTLAKTQYSDSPSATDAASAARRARHRASVLKHGDDQPGRMPRRFKKHNG